LERRGLTEAAHPLGRGWPFARVVLPGAPSPQAGVPGGPPRSAVRVAGGRGLPLLEYATKLVGVGLGLLLGVQLWAVGVQKACKSAGLHFCQQTVNGAAVAWCLLRGCWGRPAAEVGWVCPVGWLGCPSRFRVTGQRVALRILMALGFGCVS
jgi:hypothetical protein